MEKIDETIGPTGRDISTSLNDRHKDDRLHDGILDTKNGMEFGRWF